MAGMPKRRSKRQKNRRNPGFSDYIAAATGRAASYTAEKAQKLAEKAQQAAEEARREAARIEEARVSRVTVEAALKKLAAEHGYDLVKKEK